MTRCDVCHQEIEGPPHVTGPADKQVRTHSWCCWCAEAFDDYMARVNT